jgi:nitroreductase
MDIIEAIKTRRSIRQYKADPINDSELNIILEAARWAPSWANTQCTRFIVVKDMQTRAKLVETLSPNNPARTALTIAPIV